MSDFSVHKWLREIHLNENKGATMATDLISKIRSEIFPKLDNEELKTFKQYLADAFDMEVKVKEEDDKPKKETIPFYEIHLEYVFNGPFYGMYVIKEKDGGRIKLDYNKAKAFLDKYNIKPELPQRYDGLNIQAIIDQLRNRDVNAHFFEKDVS